MWLRLKTNGRTTGSFNPHTHEGCDRWCVCFFAKISSFNPHTHEGCDIRLQRLQTAICKFQSTHPRRVWLTHAFSAVLQPKFQYTHPRMVWLLRVLSSPPIKTVSIHTPTKGVTEDVQHKATILKFQSTHPRRVWLHIQQRAEYHDAKIIILRKMAK